MNKNMILSLLTTAAILAVAAGAYMTLRQHSVKPQGESDETPRSGAIEQVDPSAPAATAASAATNATDSAARRRPKVRVERVNSRDAILQRTDINETDRSQLLAINDALDAESLDDLLKILPDASVSTNEEVRSDLVDALGWFGKSALLDLMPFMADPDEDVAQAAMDHWTTALADIDNERRKCELVGSALKILTNEDALESMLLEISDCDDLLVLQTLINVIEAQGASAAAAKVALSHYEFTTGKKYTTFEDAEAWLADNYESPEDEESEDEGGASDGGESNGETATGEAASGKAAASETATGEAAPGEQQSESDSGTLPAENRSAAERASNNAATSRSDSATRASRADSGDAGADGDRQDAAEAAAAESDGDDSDGGDSDKIEDLSDDAGDFIDGEEDAEGEEGLEEDEDDGLRPSILPAGAVPAAGLVQ